MREKLHRILDLALELNEQGYTTFCDIAGHIKSVHVRIFKGEWKFEDETMLNFYAYYSEKDAELGDNTLDEIIEKLEALRGEKDVHGQPDK